MKRLNKILILLIVLAGFLPFVAKASNASVQSWKLKCDKADEISPGEKVKCHLLGIVTDATGTDANIKFLVTRVTGTAVKITSVGSNTSLSHYDTEANATFQTGSNYVPRSAGSTCAAGLGCYDWYKSGGTIKRDLSSSISTGSYATSNDFAYFEVEILANQLTNDTDCAKICVYADTVLEGSSSITGGLVGNLPDGCMELHLRNTMFCSYDGTHYYNSTGQTVTQQEYLLDCFACKKVGNKYYDSNGAETDEAGYKRSCGCRIVDGTYYDNNNQVTTRDNYERICNPHCKCDNNGKCYNDNGKEVTRAEYERICNPHCECDSNGKCYNDNGQEVTREEYIRVCNPKCYCDDEGQCYDDNGEPVTEEEYKEACACRIEDGKYYDNNGQEVTEEEFQKKCNPKCYCNSEGQCYDGKGKPVTKAQYQKACGCRKENGKYYDNKGEEVDEKTWNAKCVPGTGSFAPYISILTLLLGGYGIFNLIKYYKNNKKIYKV